MKGLRLVKNDEKSKLIEFDLKAKSKGYYMFVFLSFQMLAYITTLQKTIIKVECFWTLNV